MTNSETYEGKRLGENDELYPPQKGWNMSNTVRKAGAKTAGLPSTLRELEVQRVRCVTSYSCAHNYPSELINSLNLLHAKKTERAQMKGK